MNFNFLNQFAGKQGIFAGKSSYFAPVTHVFTTYLHKQIYKKDENSFLKRANVEGQRIFRLDSIAFLIAFLNAFVTAPRLVPQLPSISLVDSVMSFGSILARMSTDPSLRKIVRNIPAQLFALHPKPVSGNFEFERENCLEDFPLYWRL